MAVLYFENRSPDSTDAYLADGVTEEIISRLSSVARLRVASRHLVRRFRGTAPDPAVIARSLNVSYLVTGTVQRGAGRVRVSAELIQADGSQVWGRQFDQQGSDVFAIQEAVATDVAGGIVGRLVPAERAAIAVRATRQPAALDAMMRGNFFLARRDSTGLARAIEEYERALRIDSTYADAQARLALALALSEWNGSPLGIPYDTIVARSLRLSEGALRKAPRSADAWLALASARGLATPRDLAPAIEAARRAVSMDSSNAEAHHTLGTLFQSAGQGDSGAPHQHQALALEPRRPITLINFAEYAMRLGRWDEARMWNDSALRIDPDFYPSRSMKVLLLLQQDDTTAVRRELQAWQAYPALRLASFWIGAMLDARADSAARVRFDRQFGWQVAPRVVQPVFGMVTAFLYLRALGDREGAIAAFEHTRRSAALAQMMQGVAFVSLRDDPRYQQVLRESLP